MGYIFEIVGVSPILYFFNHQQATNQNQEREGPEYLAAYRCTLDSLIESVEALPPYRGWNLDQVVDTVINFWLHNAEQVRHWQRRLDDAGSESLLVSRVADLGSLRAEFEALLED